MSRSSACPELSVSVLREGHLDPPLPLRSPSQPAATVLASGFARLESCFSLSLIDVSQFDVPLSVRSSSCVDAAVSVLDVSTLEPSMLPRRPARPGPVSPASNHARTGMPPPSQSLARPGPASLVLSTARPGARLVALDAVNLGLAIPARSLVCLGSVSPPSDSQQVELSSSPRCTACPGLLVSVFGLSCLGSVFKLPAADKAQLDPLLSTQSRLRLGLRVSALGFGKSGLCLSLRAVGRFGPNLPVFGFVKLNYAETVSIADYINFGPQTPLRSFARLGFSAPVSLRASVASTLPLRGPARVGFPVLVFSLARPGLSLLVSGGTGLGPALPSKSLT